MLGHEKVRVWYYKTLLPCLEPDGRLFLMGTRYHCLDLYGHLIKNEMAERHQVVRALEADGSTPWPEKFSVEWLEKRRRQMGSAIFATQFQNDVEMMTGRHLPGGVFQEYEQAPDWSQCDFFIGCDPAATKADVILSGRKATSDYWTILVGARRKVDGDYSCEVFLVDLWRGRCTKQEYVDVLRRFNERYKPVSVLIETVAAQEYLAQDLEAHMPVTGVERTKDKVSRAYWLQAFFENGQVLFPGRPLRSNLDDWQALQDELILFPSAEHDDLFDGLQTMVEGAIEKVGTFFCFIA